MSILSSIASSYRETISARSTSDTIAVTFRSRAGTETTLNYNAFSIDISLSESGSSIVNSGKQALDTLKQTVATARAFPKQLARDKLAAAIAQIDLIKLLGGTKNAKTLVALAKQIADASKDYAAGEEALSGDGRQQLAAEATTTALPTLLDNANLSAGKIAVTADVAGTALDPAASAASTGKNSAKALVDQAISSLKEDDFFVAAKAALAQIRKLLRRALAQQEASPNKQVRKAAQKLAKEFNEAVDDTAEAERRYDAAAPAASAYEAANGVTEDRSDLLSSLTTGLGAQLLNISV